MDEIRDEALGLGDIQPSAQGDGDPGEVTAPVVLNDTVPEAELPAEA